ncbi:MAG: hypothetical protein ACRD30_00860 [Bryobacteraceae bacterium]
MAVYKRVYKGYSGAITPVWSRFSILPRYNFSRLFQSKFLLIFYLTAFTYPLGCVAFVYVAHNLSFLRMLNVPSGMLEVNAKFFLYFCNVQGALAYLLTAFIGPGLISPDLANNAAPLYFSRPFSRAEYVAGKMSMIVLLLSMITWIPGLILFAIQSSLAGWEWTRANLWIAGAVFIGPMAWIVVLSLIAMAMSAWVKWKIAAGALILGIFFAGAAFGAAINAIMRTKYGTLADLAEVNFTIWSKLFRSDAATGIDASDAWIALGAVCAVCLWLLAKKIRPFEVVK